jgi:hypothetical protein
MKFNKFVWELYRRSNRGRKAIRRFAPANRKWRKTFPYTMIPCDPEPLFPFELFDEFKKYFPISKVSIDIAKLIRDSVRDEKLTSLKKSERYYRGLVRNGVPFEMRNKKGKKRSSSTFRRKMITGTITLRRSHLACIKPNPNFFCRTIFDANSIN